MSPSRPHMVCLRSAFGPRPSPSGGQRLTFEHIGACVTQTLVPVLSGLCAGPEMFVVPRTGSAVLNGGGDDGTPRKLNLKDVARPAQPLGALKTREVLS
jgi:hypothetical protein